MITSMSVLVTGATGFLGQSLTKALVKTGQKVRILKRLKTDLDSLADLDLDVCHGDIIEPESVAKAVDGIDRVYHLAGVVAYKPEELDLMRTVNIQGTEVILKAAQKAGVKNFIHMSSVVTIGASATPTTILHENSPPSGGVWENFGYFATKRQAEEKVRQVGDLGTMKTFIVNPSTIYGPGDFAKSSRGFQLKVARGKMPFYTSGGVSICHVEDVVQAVLRIHRYGRPNQRYILSGENWTIHKLFLTIADLSNSSKPFLYLPNWIIYGLGWLGKSMQSVGLRSPLSPETARLATLFHWFDHTRAKEDLNYSPRAAKQALEDSINWAKTKGLLNK